jgi:putative restriction endonuclease
MTSREMRDSILPVSSRNPRAEQRLLDILPRIRTWKKGSQRAPHKPLLLLLALGRVQRGEPRWVHFTQVEEKLRQLLMIYGPDRGSHQPELPFWHLQSDGLWEIPGGDELEKRKGKQLPLVAEMRRAATGGFSKDIYDELRANPELLRRTVRTLLDEHFPVSYHEDLLTAVGLELTDSRVGRARRDPSFRDQVLNAYGYQCAVCGLAPILDGVSTALEAAHIRWHSHGGPSTIENGLCLCPLHHKGLDLGVLGISKDRRVLISSRLHGGEATEESFGRYHHQLLRRPVHGHPPVQTEYVRWHTQQVFKNPPRR